MIQVTPVIHAVEERIGQPAEEDRPEPENIHLFDRVPGVGQILIAERDKENSGNGKNNEEKTQDPLEFRVHVLLLSPLRH